MSLGDFTAPLVGGMLIGGAALLLYATLGRIAGVSGIAFNAASSTGAERHWRLAFLGGLIAGGWIAVIAFGFFSAPAPRTVTGIAIALVAGALVGFGTRMGNGCTSGHGVCGISRLSRRSITATIVFMATAAVTVLVVRVLGGWA
jgi:hypothetical protein